MAKGYILSEDDVRIIKTLVSAEVSRVRNTQGRAGRELDDIQAPDVYVAKTPVGGIPGLLYVDGVTDLPGSAECDIYQLIDDNSFAAVEGLSKLVFNLDDSDVMGHTWVLVCRDKFGNWYVCEVGATESGRDHDLDDQHNDHDLDGHHDLDD